MKKYAILFASFIILIIGSASSQNSMSPIQLTFDHIWYGKPPLKIYCMNMAVKNKNNGPRWYIFPSNGEDTLNANGMLPAYNDWTSGYLIPEVINGTTADGKSGKFITLHYIGQEGSSFRAFLLPANSLILVADYGIHTWVEELAGVEVWEAESILVNGKTRLEEWLPWNMASTAGVTITKTDRESSSYGLLDFKGPEKEIPSDKVEYLQVTGFSTHYIKFTP